MLFFVVLILELCVCMECADNLSDSSLLDYICGDFTNNFLLKGDFGNY